MYNKEIYFLSFLESLNPIAAQNAKKMEELIFEDPGSAIVKARLFAEAILNEVFKQDKINAPYLSSLFDKISYLTREGYIKREIQQSFDTIRLSGNKAAHDGGFNDITEAFKLHKEMYKIGVWFYEVYSLDQLKVPLYEIPKPPQKEQNIEDIVKKQILELLGSTGLEGRKDQEEENLKGEPTNGEVEIESSPSSKISNDVNSSDDVILNKNLQQGESYLIRELSRLKDSSQEAIENASQFSHFKNYMHVDRKIQLDLEEILRQRSEEGSGNLILLCGSVGDGKSHLLAYLNEKKHNLIKDYKIFNDATESFSPNKDAMETLEEVLKDFSDNKFDESNAKVILAINMGVLHNFIYTDHKHYTYEKLKKFVESSNLFSQSITTHFSSGDCDLLSFGDYHSYELTEKGPKSTFYTSLLEKVFSESSDNPFYLALMEDENNTVNTMVHENYKLFQNKFVQEQVVQLVLQTIVKDKLVISARAFLNFISDILIPDEMKSTKLMSEFEVLKNSLPNLLFNRRERSAILNALSKTDPIHHRSIHIDQLVIDLNTLNDWESILNTKIKDETAIEWLKPFINNDNLTDFSFNLFFESFVRITFITNKEFALNVADKSYEDFMKNLYRFNIGEKKKIKKFYDEVKTAIYKWKGSPKREYIYLNKPTEKYRLAQKINVKPTIDHLESRNEEVLETFKASIVLAYHDNNKENKIYLDIDYQLYKLLTKVQEGYRPNKKDEEDAIKFVEFIEKLMAFGEKKNEILIHFPNDNKFYTIKRDDFEAFVFERE
jgi:DNA phosphorothioation-dependent restriction protein DptF